MRMEEKSIEDIEDIRERHGLDSKLLESRTILISQPIDDRLTRNVMARLLVLDQADRSRPITVFINSPGGSADCGLALYDMIKFVRPPVRCVASGLCASAAVIIYVGARRGMRFATPNARFLMHQPSTSAFGQASDVEITAKEMLKLRERAAQIIGNEIGVPPDKIVSDATRDFWLDAGEAMKYKLVDRIVSGRGDLDG